MIKFWDPVVTFIGSKFTSLADQKFTLQGLSDETEAPRSARSTRAAGEGKWCGWRWWWKQDKLMMNYWILGFVDVDAALSLELFFFMFYVARLTFCLDIKTCFGRPVVDLGMSQRPLNPRFFQPRCWMVVAKDSGQSENCSYVVCKMCHHESWWYKYIDDVIPCWRTCGFELYRMYTQSLLAASVFSSRLPATRRYQKIQGRL